MKLHFKKNDNNVITVNIEKGLDIIEFDYVEMLKLLVTDNRIECDWENIEQNEQLKLQELVNRIVNAVKAGLEKPIE